MLLLIPLLPFLGFVINAFLGRRLSKSISGSLACLAMIGSFAVSVAAVLQLAGHEYAPVRQTLFTWMDSGSSSPPAGQMHLTVPFGLAVDTLSAVMILVVTGIGSLIHIYSTGYMHEESDSEYARYFSYLNLFAAFMLVLVLGSNFPVMFIGWEGVGLCSYLLIGYWYTKKSASDAGKKAFVVNRIGDFGFILGMLLIFVTFGTLEFQEVAQRAAERPVETAGIGVLTAATLLLFLGAAGKSAQIPLYVWLPDAMEGPTPVSALIHAATMVTAGVYMIGRNAVLFEHAPITMAVVAAVGVATALLAGTIGLVQNDIKRVLAYSTVSQLGFMFLAMGVGAFAAGIFHLYTHAFFKALLFLGSGAVIHALAGEQDIRNMGGLRKHLPITYWTFVIGALAIAGIPLLSGFFSKDEILYRTFITDLRWPPLNELLYVIGVLTSLLTAIYMFRLVFLTFHGERRHMAPPEHPEEEEPAAHGHGHGVPAAGGAHGAVPTHAHVVHGGHTVHAAHGGHGGHGIHDAPWSMAIPLILLAIGSVVAGYVGVPHALGGSNRIESFLHPSFQPPGAAHGAAATATHAPAATADTHAPAQEAAHGAPAGDHGAAGNERTELMLMALSSGIAVAGIGIAAFFWLRRPEAADAMERRFAPVHRVLLGKYYVDELYDATVVHPIQRFSTGGLWKGVDATVIDGAVNGVGLAVRESSNGLRRMQTGSIRAYAASLFAGVVLILGWYLWT